MPNTSAPGVVADGDERLCAPVMMASPLLVSRSATNKNNAWNTSRGSASRQNKTGSYLASRDFDFSSSPEATMTNADCRRSDEPRQTPGDNRGINVGLYRMFL